MRILRTEGGDKNKFDAHFKERLRNLEVEPSPELWDKIEGGLNEERENVKYDHWYHVALILLAFLTAANLYINYNFDKTHHYPSDNISSTDDIQSFGLFGSLPFQSCMDNNDSPIHWDCENSTTPIFIACANQQGEDKGIIALLNDVKTESSSETANYFSEGYISAPVMEMQVKKSGIIKKMNEDKLSELRDNPVFAENQVKKTLGSIEGFHLGFTAGVNTGWLFFREKTLSPIVVDNVKRKFNSGSQYAISFGYDFSHQFGVQVDWVFLSKQGQKYVENRFRKILLNTEIDMTYMHVPVMFKYKWTRISAWTQNPKSLNFLLGFQYSRLRGVEVAMNNKEIVSERNVFHQNELGPVFGIEYDFFLHKNYYLTLGTRGWFSADPVRTHYINNDKSNIYHVYVGVNVGINYHLPFKRKAR